MECHIEVVDVTPIAADYLLANKILHNMERFPEYIPTEEEKEILKRFFNNEEKEYNTHVQRLENLLKRVANSLGIKLEDTYVDVPSDSLWDGKAEVIVGGDFSANDFGDILRTLEKKFNTYVEVFAENELFSDINGVLVHIWCE